MIDDIDKLRISYVGAISKAVTVHAELCTIDPAFRDLKHVPNVDAIDEMNMIADEVINAWAQAQHNIDNPEAVFNVGGDMIHVGDITDSENIAIGKDIAQEITE